MADIIDSFVVTLGLDPRDYNKEISKYRDDRKKLGEEEKKQNQTRQDEQRGLVDGVRTLRNETIGFFAVLRGADGIKNFARDLLTSDAATGRFAANIGLATTQLSAWEEAVKRVGGQEGDARGALGAMSSAFQSLQLTGTTGHDADFAGLGVTRADLANPEQALLKIAQASSRMSRPEFTARAGRIGLNDPTITLLAQGRPKVEALLDSVEKMGVATAQSAKDAQEFDKALADLTQLLKSTFRPAITSAAATLTAFVHDVTDSQSWFGKLRASIKNIDKRFTDWDMKWSDKVLDPIADSVWGRMFGMENSTERKARQAGAHPAAARGSGAAPSKLTNRVLSSGGGGTDPEIYQALAARYGAEVAAGITSGIKAEGGSLGMAKNGAFGIGQWRGPRLKALIKKYGPNPTKAQQLEFLMWELEGGDPGGKGVLASRNKEDALSNYIGGSTWGFMRPGAGRTGDMARGMAALGRPYAPSVAGGGGSSMSQQTTIGQIVIYSQATDAQGVARDLRGELGKRGLVVQANTGLQP